MRRQPDGSVADTKGSGSEAADRNSETRESDESTGRIAVRGVRWVFWLSAVTLPMSFVTNLVLGRTSAEVLGLYSAIQIFIGGFQTFFIFGGNAVFTRFVPALPRERRLGFLASYLAVVLGVFTCVWLLFILFGRDLVHAALLRFGAPRPAMAYGVAASVVVWAFASHFLYGVERAPRAAAALKVVVVGYFLFAVLCLSPLGPAMLRAPARALWITTAITYAVAALIAAGFVARLDERTVARKLAWFLPAGFWSVVVYTHLGTVVEFVYSSLSPSVVLLWLDVAALGRLTAALRWVGLLALLPGMLVSVVAPGLTKLEASGLRAEALRQARSAVRVAELAVVPSVLGLVLFAPELMGVFGHDYRDYAGLLRIVALSALAGPTVYLGGGLAVAVGALRAYLAVSVAYVVSSVVLNVVLVPAFGLTGAALATSLSAVVQCAAVTMVIRGLGFSSPRTTWLGGLFGAAALGFAWSVAPAWPVAAAAWILATALFAWAAGVTPAELRLLAARLVGLRS